MSKFLSWLEWPIILLTVMSCTGQSTEILSSSPSASTSTDSYIVTASWDGNHRAVTIYDIDGNYIRHVDFRSEGTTPRGLELLDANTILVSTEGADALYTVDLEGNKNLFYGSNQLNGAIFDVEYDRVGGVIYVAESDNIEAFTPDGERLTTMRIPTTTGACTIDDAVGLDINTDGNLVVSTTSGGDQILVYDITTTPPTCLSSVDFGGNPFGILAHSDGNLYVATQGSDEIFRTDPDGSNPVLIWAADTAIINNPEALQELPNGNILVSSTNLDTVEIIQTDGTRVGSIPFIRDALSLRIGDILVIDGNSQ